MTKCEALYPLGRWDEVDEIVELLSREDDARGGSQVGVAARAWAGIVAFGRGDTASARRLWNEVLPAVRRVRVPQVHIPALAHGVGIYLDDGDLARAEAVADELAELAGRHPVYVALHLPDAARALVGLGRSSQLPGLADLARAGGVPFLEARLDWMRGLAAAEDGDHQPLRDAALEMIEMSDRLSNRVWATEGRISAAEAELALGRPDAASALIGEARRSAAELGAGRFLAHLDRLEASPDTATG